MQQTLSVVRLRIQMSTHDPFSFKKYLETTNVVVLEPDVANKFKTAASVNKALRAYLKVSKRGLTTGSTATARKRAAR